MISIIHHLQFFKVLSHWKTRKQWKISDLAYVEFSRYLLLGAYIEVSFYKKLVKFETWLILGWASFGPFLGPRISELGLYWKWAYIEKVALAYMNPSPAILQFFKIQEFTNEGGF